MKSSIVHSKQKLFECLIYCLAFLPIVSFITYALTGLFFNHSTVYFIIYISFIFLSVSLAKALSKPIKGLIRLFMTVLLMNLLGHVVNQGAAGVIDFFRTISGYYMFLFISFIIYQLYYKRGDEKKVLLVLIKLGKLISVVNILHYIYLASDNFNLDGWSITFNNYQLMADYLTLLNKNFVDYIVIGLNYDNAIRPVGYFYDTHSQYFIPLCTCIILLFKKKMVRNQQLWLVIMVVSIILSSIKTAYATIVIVLALLILKKWSLSKVLKYSIPGVAAFGLLFKNKIMAVFAGDNFMTILIQLSQHVSSLPFLLASTSPLSFLIGGATFLREEEMFYSEVFLVTLLFYIGIVGLFVFLRPLNMSFIRDKRFEIGIYLYLALLLSLSHYGVYSVGVNNFASALPFMYYLGYVDSNVKLSPNKRKLV